MSGMADNTARNEKTNDYKGKIMIGTVVDNNDPNHWHRLRISVPDIMEGDADELPWAIPETLAGGAGASDEATQNIPSVGTAIYVWLQDGDTHFPVYRGQVMSSTVALGVLEENYPNRVGFVRAGHHEFIDYMTNLWERLHSSGFLMQIDEDGNLVVNGPDTATITLGGALNVNVTGDVNFSASGGMTLKAGGAMIIQGSSVQFKKG